MAMIVTWLPWSFMRWIRHKDWPEWQALRTFYRKRLAIALLRRMLVQDKPDIIHVKGRVVTESFSVFPSDRTVYQHTLMGTVDPSWEPSEVEEFRKFLHRIARVFVQGRVIVEIMKREFRLDREIDVIPTMVPDEVGERAEAQELRTEDSELRTGAKLRFGILCRFTEQKGISYILDALKMFYEKHGEVHFTFAGAGPLEELVRDRRSEIGGQRPEVGSRTSDLRPQAADIRIERVRSAVETLRDIDVFVHPGIDDAMPVSVVEALMCGIPCVTTRVGATQEIVRDGIEGYLIEPSSSDEILEAMERCTSWTVEELQEFRRRARARYEAVCRPEVVGLTVAQHYRDIMMSAESKLTG